MYRDLYERRKLQWTEVNNTVIFIRPNSNYSDKSGDSLQSWTQNMMSIIIYIKLPKSDNMKVIVPFFVNESYVRSVRLLTCV